jgi:PKHD-type hydroxylase
MLVLLDQVLDADGVARVREGLAAAPLVDGRRTAGARAAAVKANRQADGRDGRVQALERFVHQGLGAHLLFQRAVRPSRISRLLFSVYGVGDTYGLHTDDAVMGDPPLRTDVAFTLFLAAPETYDGGALTVTGPSGVQEVKLRAGDAVVYPAGTIHGVGAVTAGERWACVGWAQSLIRDPWKRELLFELDGARAALADGPREALLQIDKVQSGLVRLWAEL